MEAKAIIHGVQRIDSRRVEAVYGRSNRGSASTDDELVVIKRFCLTIIVFNPNGLTPWINAGRKMVRQNLDTGELGAMCEILPMRGFSWEQRCGAGLMSFAEL